MSSFIEKIYHCPNCKGYLRYIALSSNNSFFNFTKSLYSDGVELLRSRLLLVKCGHCLSFFWIDDLEPSFIKSFNTLGHNAWEAYIPFPDNENTTEAEIRSYLLKVKASKAKLLDFNFEENLVKDVIRVDCISNCLEALQYASLRTVNDELDLRLFIWRAYNDRVRAGLDIFNTLDDKLVWETNVKKIIEILKDLGSDYKITLSELYRNIGEFKTSIGVLKSIKDVTFNNVKNQLQKACEEKQPWVIELKLNE